MTAAEAWVAPHRAVARFAPYHRWDRNFFLGYMSLIWMVVLAGFVPDVIHHVQAHQPPYPLVVHFHAVVFVGWLILLNAQMLLVRAKRLDIHRALGFAGVALLVAVVSSSAPSSTPSDQPKVALPA